MFQWDEKKQRQVIAERNVDIVYAALIFAGPVLTSVDEREDYGEVREISIGVVDGECFVVLHTNRNGDTRLITGWKAGHRDHERYQARIARSDPDDEEPG